MPTMIVLRHPEPGEPSQATKESGRYPKRKVQWMGLTIAIENEAGTYRRGTNRDGGSWETLMCFAYGDIRGTEGVDGDPVDVFLGSYMESAPLVYVVHQRRRGDWDNYDEDKCMIGFDCEESARSAFLSCYNDPRFLGPITAMPVAEFVDKVRATKEKPAMIKSVLLVKGFTGTYVRNGKTVKGYATAHTRRADDHRQTDMFAAAATPAVNEQFTSVHNDANGRDSHGYKSCPTCATPYRGNACDNPGCDTNVSQSVKDTRAAAHAKEQAGEAERERIRKIRSSMTGGTAPAAAAPRPVFFKPPEVLPEGHTRAHYATIVRNAGQPNQRVGWLAGPFKTNDEAKAHVEGARAKASAADPWSDFDGFGTSSRVAKVHPPGVLNKHLGIK